MLNKTVTRSSDAQKGIKMFPTGYQFPNGEFKTFKQMDDERMAAFRSGRPAPKIETQEEWEARQW